MPFLNLTLFGEEKSNGIIAGRDTKGLSIELISEVESIQQGKAFRVGLKLTHDKGFHTYWKNPGVVGMPTAVKWTLPKGFTVSKLHWPYPELSKMAEYPCFGYERDVLLYVDITPPKKTSEKNVKLTANVNWMCCSNTCHPGFKEFSLTLPYEAERLNSESTKQFKQAEAELPITSKDITAELQSAPDAQAIVVKIICKEDILLKTIFSSDGQTTPDLAHSLKKISKGIWHFETKRFKYGVKSANTFPFVVNTDKGYFQVVAVTR